jgi:hypothetical protein
MYDRRLGLSLTILVSAMAGTAHQSVPTMIYAMFRYKRVLGLPARTLPTQKTEVACKVINIMTALGMPVSRRIA